MLARMMVSRCCCDEAAPTPPEVEGAISEYHGPGVGSSGDQNQAWSTGSWFVGQVQAPPSNDFSDGMWSGANFNVKGQTCSDARIIYDPGNITWSALWGQDYHWELSGHLPPVNAVTNNAADIAAANKTVARVQWQGSDPTGNVAQTPNIASIINEIINDPAFENTQRIEVFMLKAGDIEGRQTNFNVIPPGATQLRLTF